MSNAIKVPGIIIRDIELISEMREVESLQKEAWELDDRYIVPLTILAATREIGAILVGAFHGSSLIGFAYSFVGRENQHMVHHSHMLAVPGTISRLEFTSSAAGRKFSDLRLRSISFHNGTMRV